MNSPIIRITYLSLISILILNSCDSDNKIKNPADYELYINISADQYPDISPDAKYIAYYHKCLQFPESLDYPTGLYLIDTDGTNRRLLIQGDHWNPSWSPDGQWIVFTSNGVLQIINFEGDSLKTFQGINNVPLYFPDWSPDGSSILFSSPYVEGGGFFICDPDFQNVKQIFNLYELSGSDPNWSPNGSSILYSKYVSNNEEIYIIDTTGINDTRLTTNDRSDLYPSWSPNGQWIAWSSGMQIHLMNYDGSNQSRYDYGRYPTWSPDSKKLIYSNANFDFSKEVLFQMDIEDKKPIQITF